MMWSILQIFIGLTLSAIYVYGIGPDIKKAITRRDLIYGIFRPINIIGEGSFSSIFKGVNMINNRDVAMKISEKKSESKHEYEMYSYLNAIDNPDVEKYGISPIYYYDKCGNDTLTVFSLFECELWQKKVKSKAKYHTIDCLILFRDFVRQSKYIHSRGIRHDDVQPKNIMLRKNRSFLIDFNLSSKMKELRRGGSLLFGSRRFHRQLYTAEPLRRYLDDWESFLYTMAFVADVKLQWFDFRKYIDCDEGSQLEKFGTLKERTAETIEQIEKDIKCEHLKQIMFVFAKEAFKTNGKLPRYNYFEELITAKIDEMIGKDQPAVFSWLAGHERDEAIKDLENNPPATATEIDEPKTTYRANDYKEPDYDYFKNHRDAMAQKAYENNQRYLKEEHKKDLQKQMEPPKLETTNEQMEKKKVNKKNSFMKNGKKFAGKCLRGGLCLYKCATHPLVA